MRRRQLNTPFDVAIIGSGFAGSLMAMIASRLGRSVVLLEQGRHPRFAIGESSTPLANLLLERLARDYDLPQVASLCKWGSWQHEHADLAVGLKRGFSFYHHQFDKVPGARADRANQLLVAASPHDAIADTHWYRPDLDHYLVRQAVAMGVEYQDRVQLGGLEQGKDFATLHASREGQKHHVSARLVIDASGPRGFLHRTLALPDECSGLLPPRRAFFAHFRDVQRLDDLSTYASGASPPFPVDDAAVHHVFDGGWIWVLRFNNGLTSAGAAVTEGLAAKLGPEEGVDAWRALLRRLPVVDAQFSGARTASDFLHVRNLGFRSSRYAGQRWVMLPSAAGFVDPLLSSGFALTLLGLKRIANAIEHDWNTPRFAQSLECHEQQTSDELSATERLVAALYATMDDFPMFASISRLYFAAASFSEASLRLDAAGRAGGYLMHDHAHFGPGLRAICDRVIRGYDAADRVQLMHQVDLAIEPVDVAGLGDHSKQNWYPVDAADLINAAGKLGVQRDALERLLEQTGFYA